MYLFTSQKHGQAFSQGSTKSGSSGKPSSVGAKKTNTSTVKSPPVDRQLQFSLDNPDMSTPSRASGVTRTTPSRPAKDKAMENLTQNDKARQMKAKKAEELAAKGSVKRNEEAPIQVHSCK